MSAGLTHHVHTLLNHRPNLSFYTHSLWIITQTPTPERNHTPMMLHSFRMWLIWMFFLWTALLHFVFTAAQNVEDASSFSRRAKRDWHWNRLQAFEEHVPQKPIGRFVNTKFNENARFSLSGDGAHDLFEVNENGDVLVLKRLDREKKSEYALTAHIFNKNNKAKLEEDSEFIIEVVDINDNSPIFSETYTGSINERSRTGTFVLTAHATDADDPTTPNGQITYKLLNGTKYFSIDGKTGQISTAVSTLDRETQSEYKVTVQASDLAGSDGGRSATTIVTISISDINDNTAYFSKSISRFEVKEDEKSGFKIGTLLVEDQDETQNKKPTFRVQQPYNEIFEVELNENNDGVLTLKEGLDYETKSSYTFSVTVQEEDVVTSPDNSGSLQISSQIFINIIDVDEPPVFNQPNYTFNIYEGPIRNKIIGSVSAKDMDKTNHRIRYSIEDPKTPVEINHETGQLFLKRELDREHEASHMFQVTAQEQSPNGQKSYALLKINVLDINDNKPELANWTNVYICENDRNGTVIGIIGATDEDENSGKFRFSLAKRSSNFSLHDNLDNTASIILTHGGFSTESSVEHVLEIEITDGGTPPQRSVTPLHLRVCTCGEDRRESYCKHYISSGVSMSALIAILLCIVTILVIVILFVLRKRYQKEALVALGKSSGEIHEQLVCYDEEGGGEMDTNGYDVSVLSSVQQDRGFGPDPTLPAMYAIVNKSPAACKGDMAVMIEVKKDEADHDRDGIPYDTLHIYGYEGSESLAGSLSSLGSSSSLGSELEYDFLTDWGPRFRTLAQLYGYEEDTSY